MNDDDIMLAREKHQTFVERAVGDCGSRIVRIGHDHRLGAVGNILRDVCKIQDPIVFRPKRIKRDCRPGHQRAKGEDRIARVRHQNNIVRPGKRKAHMGDALLRAADRHNLVVCEGDVVPALIPVFDRVEQRAGFIERILILRRVERRLADRLHHMLVRLKIRRADRQVDDIHPAFQQRTLALVQPVENIAFCGLPRSEKLHDSIISQIKIQ